MTKILLVEDDKSLREIYGVRLLAEGYDIVSAGDGEEALAMAIKERPDLIVSDVMMPKISGFDMLDILRSTTETRGIKVIMMTALSSEDQRARGEALGADRYLVKSQVGIEDVVRTVHEVLGDAPVTSAPANVFSSAQQQNPAPVQQSAFSPQSTVPPRPAPAPTYAPAEPARQEPAAQPTYAAPAAQQSQQQQQQPAQQQYAPQQQYAAPATPLQSAPQQQQQPAPTYAPAEPARQEPAAQPTYAAPAAQQPQQQQQQPAQQQYAPQPTAMPQPTAPFSTNRPANLGDRIIHPIQQQAQSGPDLSSLMDQELGRDQQPHEAMTPMAPRAPESPATTDFSAFQQPTQPTEQAPQQEAAPTQSVDPEPHGATDIAFEETPRQPTTPTPPTYQG